MTNTNIKITMEEMLNNPDLAIEILTKYKKEKINNQRMNNTMRVYVLTGNIVSLNNDLKTWNVAVFDNVETVAEIRESLYNEIKKFACKDNIIQLPNNYKCKTIKDEEYEWDNTFKELWYEFKEYQINTITKYKRG